MAITTSAPERPRYRKRAIPCAVRREVAQRYGCSPGERLEVPCHYCGAPGFIRWTMSRSWVTFDHELDHVIPEVLGGPSTADNIVLACQPCNRRKGARA